MLHEIKGKLAKLLATENLIIEHRDVTTASFDVERRVLTLPMWQINSEDVYDLLVAHEVGHALYTDPRNWFMEDEYKDLNPSLVNITEDARIEKLMKRRYAGLNKTFSRGYTQLNEDDFFETQGEDLATYSFPDRINLWFKVGAFLNIKFSNKEKEIVDLVGKSETFDDALVAAKRLSAFIEENQTKDLEFVEKLVSKEGVAQGGLDNPMDLDDLLDDLIDQQSKEDKEVTEGDGNNFKPEDVDGDFDLDDGLDDEDDTEDLNYKGTSGGTHATNDFETKTVDSLAEKLEELAGKFDPNREAPVYLSLPKIDLNRTVVPVDDIHSYIEDDWNTYEERMGEEYARYGGANWVAEWHKDSEDAYQKFKRSTGKEVSYLVKEFEMKKAASAYARAATSKTGVLDCLKLHQYKYNDDIFKKITVLPDGKNHGLIFVLDWSGSMADVLLNTVKQMYNLIWFSRKVGIPYEVYAFTNEWYYYGTKDERPEREEQGSDELFIEDHFSLMNLLSSNCNAKECERQMLNIWKIAEGFCTRHGVTPRRMSLSGTPLNEALLSLHEIIPQFQKNTGVEKVNCVVLTDGEASSLCRTAMVQRDWEDRPELRHKHIRSNCFLRHNGYTRRLSDIYFKFTKILLDDLKSSFPQVNFVGFRLLGNRDLSSMISHYIPDFDSRDRARADWKKHKSFTIKNQGYDSFFVLSSNNLSNTTEFEVAEDATKAQIRSAFKKSFTNKKMNKKVLGEFVEMVA
tara:strand:+ start:8779 stop:11001 length:2223 start_codon:yes stop_codon:yes gene_type:complete